MSLVFSDTKVPSQLVAILMQTEDDDNAEEEEEEIIMEELISALKVVRKY